MPPVLRWLAAVAAGVAIFETLDALSARGPAAGWLPLISPCIAGATAGWGAGGGAASQLLASAVMAWARIGADRAVGILHGVRQPPEVQVAVMMIFGLPWMLLAVGGGATQMFVRRAARRARYGSSPRVT